MYPDAYPHTRPRAITEVTPTAGTDIVYVPDGYCYSTNTAPTIHYS